MDIEFPRPYVTARSGSGPVSPMPRRPWPDPDGSSPYLTEIWGALGLGHSHEDMRRIRKEITARAPHHCGAHCAALQYRCAKRRGSGTGGRGREPGLRAGHARPGGARGVGPTSHRVRAGAPPAPVAGPARHAACGHSASRDPGRPTAGARGRAGRDRRGTGSGRTPRGGVPPWRSGPRRRPARPTPVRARRPRPGRSLDRGHEWDSGSSRASSRGRPRRLPAGSAPS